MQVLAKSAKVIPVMLMGKLVSRAQYKNYEYATAVLISVGMTAFLLGSGEGKKGMQINRRFFLRLIGFLSPSASLSSSDNNRLLAFQETA